jgi:hypothetical protein
MSTTAPFEAATMTTERLGQLGEQLLEANRAACQMFFDMYENALESLASYQEQTADYTDVDWIATAARTQAALTRELAKQQLAVGRELIKLSHELPVP